MRRWNRAVSLAVAGLLLTLAAPSQAAPRPWVEDTFDDLLWAGHASLDPAEGGEIVLDPPFTREGARFDLLVVGPEPGRLRLTQGASTGPIPLEGGGEVRAAGSAASGGLVLNVLEGTEIAPGSRLLVREGHPDGIVAVRWVGYRGPLGHPATFEARLEPDGTIRYQYLQVPPGFRLPATPGAGESASRVELFAPSYGRLDLVEEGFRPAPGRAVAFPPGEGSPEAMAVGCGQDESWCSVAEQVSFQCTEGARAAGGGWTPCGTTQSDNWHFNESMWCQSCPYSFYIVVECGTEMHLPFFDVEGMVATITDVFTGTQLELEAVNQCARQPFGYCNQCNTLQPAIWREDQVGTCATPLVPCEPFLQTSSRIAWGVPEQDLDGDGQADDLPCGPANRTGCPTINQTGTQLAHEQQVTDIVLTGDPGLCGVFRVDLVSGGWDWFLFSNCTGTQEPDFDIYTRCEDALNAFDPLPELVITDFSYSGVCPSIELEVEVTNVGCVDTTESPLMIDFERNQQDDVTIDLGPVPVSTSVVSSIPVTLGQTPMIATASIDIDDTIFECSEDTTGGSTSCIPQTGAESITQTLCACENNARASVVDDRIVSCGGEPVEVDASASTVVPCANGSPVYRFLAADGTVLRDWSVSSTFQVTPSLCPSLIDYTVEVACDDELEPDCIDTASFQVECAPNPEIDLQASANDICAGDTVVLDAGRGFASYTWSTGETSSSVEVSPASTTVYGIDVVSSKGCSASDQIEVRVSPDPVPGALGNILRVRRQGEDLAFDFTPPAIEVGAWELVSVLPAGCPAPPAPDPTPFIFSTSPVLASGPAPPLVHPGGITACPDLLFYKIRGTSPCSGRAGPLCDAFSAQVLPCP